MWGVWERWEWREVRWHFNSSTGSLAVFLGCTLLPLLRAAPPWLLTALCSLRCCPITSRLHLSQLTAAVDTSLSPYWGSISSLIQPCWESLLQDAWVRRPHSHFPLQRSRRDHVQTLCLAHSFAMQMWMWRTVASCRETHLHFLTFNAIVRRT